MAASNYSVNIKLNTTAAKNDLQKLEARINKLRKNLNSPLKIDTRVSKINKEIAKSKEAQRISMIQTRKLGDQVQKLADQGLKVDKARAAIRRAALADSKGQLKLADANRKTALEELKINQGITKQKANQVRLQRQMASPIGGARTMMGSPGQIAFSGGPTSPIGGSRFMAGSPAQLAHSARMGGPRSPIGGSLSLPGSPAFLRNQARGARGFDFQSALISGGFPLLFGQGPFVGAAGALGGGIGGMFGQMGGFAGGIAATTVATTIQAFTVETGKLGAALNDATKDVEAVSAALGITGTEFEKNLRTLQKLGGEEAAFEAARQKMISLVGTEGVTALQNFGKGTTELANQFTIAMTQMKAGLASFLQGTGAGRFLLNRMTSANLIRQSKTSEDPEVVRARQIADAFNTGILRRSKEERKLVAQGRELGFNNYFDALGGVEEAQKRANKREEEAAVEKLLADIQKQRVKNISDEIVLLEKSFGLTSDEFEIEKQIMQMKQDGEIKDEAEIRNKLKHLQNLQKERQLAEETAAAFERMSQTIATDISDGIKGMIRGTSTLNDVLNSVLNKLIDAAFNMAFFGNMQGSLGGGGLFGLLGGLFGGGGPKDIATPILPTPIAVAANGGRIPGGKPSLVGEKGPELFTPAVGGYVTPNHALGGSTSVVVNVDASGSNVEGDEQQSRELGRLISVAVQSEILQQKRPGGLLA